MPGFWVALSVTLVVVWLAGAVVGLVVGAGAGIFTGLVGTLFLGAIVSFAYLLGALPDLHRHQST
jgi:hypothetical protein